jgi:hypothetical protein
LVLCSILNSPKVPSKRCSYFWSHILSRCCSSTWRFSHALMTSSKLAGLYFSPNWDLIQKRKQDITNKSNQKENKSQIPYKYKVGDQVLLETLGILRKLSTPCTGPYPVTNVYKNGTIRIQRGIVSERANIRRIAPFNQTPNFI